MQGGNAWVKTAGKRLEETDFPGCGSGKCGGKNGGIPSGSVPAKADGRGLLRAAYRPLWPVLPAGVADRPDRV